MNADYCSRYESGAAYYIDKSTVDGLTGRISRAWRSHLVAFIPENVLKVNWSVAVLWTAKQRHRGGEAQHLDGKVGSS